MEFDTNDVNLTAFCQTQQFKLQVAT